MATYRIGSALTAGKERIILSCHGVFIDLGTLLTDDRTGWHSPADVDVPVSLMGMMEDWPYWRGLLPRVADDVAGARHAGTMAWRVDSSEMRWLPPLMYPRKLICIGVNYHDHIAEMGGARPPSRPYSFLKPPTTTLVGSGATVRLPPQARMVDWEGELAVVIGQRARDVSERDALSVVAGYGIVNDLSARDWLAEPSFVGIDWVQQKAFDGFTPMGPLMTPAEFVADPQALQITTTVNEEVKQESTTAQMVFSVREIIAHLASIMTLEPGDVIATGTPAGVGYSKEPREFLRSGDRVVVEIEGLGRLETTMASRIA